MLDKSFSLDKMLKFEPHQEDMLALPLEAVVYLKFSIVSINKDDNYAFIRHLFSNNEINNYFNDINKIIFYDFDATNTDQEKFITIFEVCSKITFHELSLYLEEILKAYNHDAFVFVDLYTHDDKKYRLSDLDGLIKLEEMKNE